LQPNLENVQITDNTSSNDGGGVWISWYTNPIRTNMVISNNHQETAAAESI
jgi:hypothetical protein